MKPVQMLVPKSKYSIKCPYTMNAEYITVHNTANDASARNEISYMRNNSYQTSFHFAIDDKEVVQGLPTDRNGWHAGDGNGTGNRKTIGIEICYSKSGGARFTKAEKNAAKFIAQLLKERGWGTSRVKKHQDWSGKYCPHRTLDMGWQRFLKMVQAELTPEPKPKPKISYELITKKSIILTIDANLWDFNFTDYSKAKAVKSYKSGTKIDSIVAIATNAVGSKYYVTEYSYKNKQTNGFNVKDAIDYVETAPTQPPVEPEEPTEPPVTPPVDPEEPETPTVPTEPPIDPETPTAPESNWLIMVITKLIQWVKRFKWY